MASRGRVRKPSRVSLGPPHVQWRSHGAYSFVRAMSDGTLDGRSQEWALLKAIMHDLAADQGSTWEQLPAAKRLLIEAAAVKTVVIGLMTGWAVKHGVIGRDGKIAGCLAGNYIAYANSLRLDLQALGLERRTKDAVVDLATHLERHYGTKEAAGA